MEFPEIHSDAEAVHGAVMQKKRNSPPVKIRKAPFVAIFVFLLLGAVGIGFGEPSRVLEQATRICLSCIGIG